MKDILFHEDIVDARGVVFQHNNAIIMVIIIIRMIIPAAKVLLFFEMTKHFAKKMRI